MTTSGKHSFGSPAAAVWTPKRIFVAAAKVHEVEEVYFTLSGLAGGEGFDALEIATQALQAGGSVDDKIEQFKADIEEPLNAAAQGIFDADKDEFKARFSGRDALAAIFFCRKHGEIFVAQVGFGTKMRGKEVVFKVRQKDYPDAATTQMSVRLLTAGILETVEKKFAADTTDQQALVYPEQVLKNFAALAVLPSPVEVLKLTHEGPSRSEI